MAGCLDGWQLHALVAGWPAACWVSGWPPAWVPGGSAAWVAAWPEAAWVASKLPGCLAGWVASKLLWWLAGWVAGCLGKGGRLGFYRLFRGLGSIVCLRAFGYFVPGRHSGLMGRLALVAAIGHGGGFVVGALVGGLVGGLVEGFKPNNNTRFRGKIKNIRLYILCLYYL